MLGRIVAICIGIGLKFSFVLWVDFVESRFRLFHVPGTVRGGVIARGKKMVFFFANFLVKFFALLPCC